MTGWHPEMHVRCVQYQSSKKAKHDLRGHWHETDRDVMNDDLIMYRVLC